MDATAPKRLDTSGLKKFAQAARRTLIEQVTAKLDHVLADGSAARREQPQSVKELEKEIAKDGRDQVIERVAYTWFNRFSALRFMDANGYARIRVVSPAEGQSRPEILSEAAAGHIHEDVPPAIRQKVSALLEGRAPSRDAQGESYRLLLVAICNGLHKTMPFLFEKIADYTELLMPDDLLSSDSVVSRMQDVMTDAACEDVEIIGWLYQFYISEKKDQVFAGLKKNQKITAENIPAATQLFTPHWIVRYLVENSLGRLWLLNRPGSKLAERMDYYIAPEEPETDFLKIGKPEEIKVCDPACGSGHMLTYAFDLLHAIYEEEGYEADRIPALILANNLTGVEIDDRAGALAAFALAMKAAAKLGRRRFLRMEVTPDIVVLQNVTFTPAEMQDVAAVVGRDLFTDELRETLLQFEQAKNFGSLIVPKLRDPAETLRVVEARDFGGDLLLKEMQERVVAVLRMAEALSPKYHVVVANPPYMGTGGMNSKLQDFAKSFYPESKSDLYAIFMERAVGLTAKSGLVAMVNMQSWMFLPYFEALRSKIFSHSHLLTMAHLGPRAFDSIGGDVVSTTAFCLQNSRKMDHSAIFVRLVDGRDECEKSERLKSIALGSTLVGKYHASQDQIEHLPGKPIAYWLGENFLEAFARSERLGDVFPTRTGLQTGDNAKFVRLWHEVDREKSSLEPRDPESCRASTYKWFPLNAGGTYRRWFGNNEKVVDWLNDGENIRSDKLERLERGEILASNSKPKNEQFYFLPAVTWTRIKSRAFGVRICDKGTIFDMAGSSVFPGDSNLPVVSAFLNTKICDYALEAINPTVTTQPGDVARFPWLAEAVRASDADIRRVANNALRAAKSDWDAYETSWDFTTLPLLSPDHRGDTLEGTYTTLRAHWQGMTDDMQRLEEENNRIFIDAYGLQDELTPEVPIEEITLTCNPAYRYGVKGSEADRETRLRADTMAEFLSYAVGCMFGRYSLDAPGLILANQGEGFEDYLKRVPEPSFPPDRDNVVPVLDGDWFADDIADRFRRFLRVTFGEERFAENLAFIETALGKDIRRYFLRDFYDDHVRRYRKRPIYWMFSSPKGSFNALIYMHRYRPDTVGVVLNGYLREYRGKLAAHRAQLETVSISADASQAEKTRALKEIERLGTVIEELDAYERDALYPLATQRIEIDLDDGVKVNYARFGNALKPIKGLSDADD